MKIAIRNELKKLLNYKKFYVLLIIGLMFGCLTAVTSKLLSVGLGKATNNLIHLELGASLTSILDVFTLVYLPLLLFMAVTDLFVVEYHDLTIRFALMRPIKRFKLYAAKILAILIYAAGVIAAVFVIEVPVTLIFGTLPSISTILFSILAHIVALVPMCVMILFAAFMAQLVKSSSLLMFSMIFLCIFMFLVPLLIPINRDVFFTSYLNWHSLFMGRIPSVGRIIQILAVQLGYAATFFFGGVLLFERKEF
jgi:ABC-2 type transport system permease protein